MNWRVSSRAGASPPPSDASSRRWILALLPSLVLGACSGAKLAGNSESQAADAMPGNDDDEHDDENNSGADDDNSDGLENDSGEDDAPIVIGDATPAVHEILTTVFGVPVVVSFKKPTAAKNGSLVWLEVPAHTKDETAKARVVIGLGAMVR